MGCCHSAAEGPEGHGAPRPCAAPPSAAAVLEKERDLNKKQGHLAACTQAGTLPEEVYAQLASRSQPEDAMLASVSLSSKSKEDGLHSQEFGAGWLGTKSSTHSQEYYSEPDQTIIIYDWDDTLCPSTCLRRFVQFDDKGRMTVRMDSETQAELNLLSDQVVPLVRSSMAMGKVVIVTNARRPWVDISCTHFLPALKGLLQNIPVVYALELVKSGSKATLGVDSESLLTETKFRAMKAAVSNFYSRYPKQSWKNILSIGDALFEHTAIRKVVSDRPTTKPCRTKTIKLLEGPTIAGMVVQLSIVQSWLPKIVQIDSDIDIDLGASEEVVDSWVSLLSDNP